MNPFVKLADPSTYVACDWDLAADADGRNYWVEFFKRHINTILKLGIEAAVARNEIPDAVHHRAQKCRQEFNEVFDAFIAAPQAQGTVTILMLDEWREALLRKHGFVDAFIDLKARENSRMLPILPAVCGEIDSLRGSEQLLALIQGIFAGNIFDMGADATSKIFLGKSPDFFNTRATLPNRPWLVDDFDWLENRLLRGPKHHKVIFFIDNAGSDFLLGALPLIRWFAQRGTPVVIAANEKASLNDMTASDVRAIWPQVVATEPSFNELPIQIVSTGTGEPGIDLSKVSAELNHASKDADLVILEGMGRGMETNFDAKFSCDALNIAMIKDAMIASRAGGKLYDVVCRFR